MLLKVLNLGYTVRTKIAHKNIELRREESIKHDVHACSTVDTFYYASHAGNSILTKERDGSNT